MDAVEATGRESAWRSMAMFAAVSGAWGLNYVFVRWGLDLAAPLWLAFLRAGVGALCMFPFLVGRRSAERLARADSAVALLLGLLNTSLFFGLWFLAARDVPPGETAVVIYSFPLWVTLLAVPLLRLPLRPLAGMAVLVGFGGIVLISEPWKGGAPALSPSAVVLLLVAALSWALGTILIQRRFRGRSPLSVNAYQLLGGSAGLLVASLLLEPSASPGFSISLLLIVLWLGLAGTAVAYSLWFTLLARIPAPTLSGYTFLVPVVALAASSIAFDEGLAVVQALGVALVLGAVWGVGRGSRT